MVKSTKKDNQVKADNKTKDIKKDPKPVASPPKTKA
jgi:hypothetical protein